MKTKFKVGDYVYCVRPRDKLRYGELYQIAGLDGTLLGVKNHEPPYYADRFVHAIPDNKLNRVLFPDYRGVNGWLVEKRENYGDSI